MKLWEVTVLVLAIVAYGMLGSVASLGAGTLVHPALGVVVFFAYVIGSLWVITNRF
jgi:hypothetical protein